MSSELDAASSPLGRALDEPVEPEAASTLSMELLASVVAVGLALVYWFCLRPTRSLGTASDSARNVNGDAVGTPAKTREEQYRAFVESEVASQHRVLFVASTKRSDTLRALFDALKANLHVVDLSRTAGGSHVLATLQEMHEKAEEKQEFLFVDRKLLGGRRQVRRLLVDGDTEALGSDCDWAHVRVDTRSENGFMVLGPTTGFQKVQDVQEDRSVVAQLEARPLHTVEELQGFDAETLARCTVPLAIRSRKQRRRSKLLVCHDMRGGYQEDRFKQGCTDFEAYRFYQWDLVDVFVYFGHALVCPPPVGWITAGHRHGTRVLGTFLTEGDDGAVLCQELFRDAHSAETFASKLAAIAWLGGFDGWLINIENDVPSELVANIDVFLRTLRKGMQLQNAAAQVVWYGCLARSGKRKSHFRLDEDSAMFFRNADAFYADYGWVPDDAKFSAAFDLDRRYDAYMGIDVFGRHDMLGGGKMNCGEPLRLAWNSGVSAALFAPGWTYECYQHETQQDFTVVENLFWEGVRASWKERSPCYDALGGQNCLYSAFNAGRGTSVWAEGKRIGSAAWSNLTELDVQPAQSLHVGNVVNTATGSVKAMIAHEMAFQGGASVQMQGQLVGREKAYFKLFDVDIEFSPRRIMELSYTTATREESVCLLVLTVCPGLDRATHFVILRSADDSGPESGGNHVDASKGLSTVAKASLEKHFYLPVSTEFFEVESATTEATQGITADGWCKKTYRLGGQLWDQKHIVEIGVLCTKKLRKVPGTREDFLAYIGEVCVFGSSDKPAGKAIRQGIHSQPQWCEHAKLTSFVRHDARSVSFGIQWEFTPDGVPVRYVLVFARKDDGERIFLGKSFDRSFYAANCAWPAVDTSAASTVPFRLTIELQSVSWAGQSSTAVCKLHLEE